MKRRNSGGFTLIEILLAISIMAIILGTVIGTFHTAVTAWQTSIDHADAQQRGDAYLQQIVLGLRSAYYPESKEALDKYGFQHEDDGGKDAEKAADKISWVKLGPALVGDECPFAGVPHRVQLMMLSGGDAPDGDGLYVRAWRLDGHDDDFKPEEDVDPVLLSSAVVGFDCRMKDPDADFSEGYDPESAWLDEWEATNRVPSAVLVSIAVQPAAKTENRDREDPVVLQRCFEIPMAALSWNPTVTSSTGSSGKRTGNNRPGSGGGSNAGQGRNPGGGGNRPGEGTRPDGSGKPGGTVKPGGGNVGGGGAKPGA